ncbi:WD40-repeat-containing domain protein [Radiomyces spectabilis]|uniref:WD40-repeat-containing domain protein n=1 Tax=Radiomyces spectabilis TaxID=64574 RepID=UPI0022200CCB|nr:WD40-repeat-containing domain protein [Radiomyces spectabilis]KAI8372782.1 WD40-repeat-containing domain protein [Radiomyces spectabilis]
MIESNEEYQFLQHLLQHVKEKSDQEHLSTLRGTILARMKTIKNRFQDRLSNLPVELIIRIGYWTALIDPKALVAYTQVNRLIRTVTSRSEHHLWQAALFHHFPSNHKVQQTDCKAAYWVNHNWVQLMARQETWAPPNPAKNTGHTHVRRCDATTEKGTTVSLAKNAAGRTELKEKNISIDQASLSTTRSSGMKNGLFSRKTLTCGTVQYTHCIAVPGTPWMIACDRWDPMRGALWILQPQGDQYRVLKRLRGHRDLVSAMVATEEVVVTASLDGSIIVWDIASTSEMIIHRYTLRGHQGWVNALAMEGHVVVSGGSDDTVRKWDVETGQLLAVYRDFFELADFWIWDFVGMYP